MRLHCPQKCSSSGAPAPQFRHSSIDGARTGMGSGVMDSRGLSRGASCAEGAAAAAGLFGVRVVEHETLGQQRRVVIEGGSLKKQIALLVDEQLRATRSFEDLVSESRFTLPPKRVAETGASSALHAHTKTSLVDAPLGHQRLDLLCGGLTDLNHGRLLGPLRPLPD